MRLVQARAGSYFVVCCKLAFRSVGYETRVPASKKLSGGIGNSVWIWSQGKVLRGSCGFGCNNFAKPFTKGIREAVAVVNRGEVRLGEHRPRHEPGLTEKSGPSSARPKSQPQQHNETNQPTRTNGTTTSSAWLGAKMA